MYRNPRIINEVVSSWWLSWVVGNEWHRKKLGDYAKAGIILQKMAQSQTNLWREIARNYFDIARARGYSGNLEPNGRDNKISSIRKTCFYTAFIAANP